MNTKDRIIRFLKHIGMGQNAFEKKIGIANGYISHNQGNVGSEILAKIMHQYPELNTDWLISGKGEMIRGNYQNVDNVSGVGIVGNNVSGGGINDAACINGLMEIIKEKDKQINTLLTIVEQLNNNKKI